MIGLQTMEASIQTVKKIEYVSAAFAFRCILLWQIKNDAYLEFR